MIDLHLFVSLAAAVMIHDASYDLLLHSRKEEREIAPDQFVLRALFLSCNELLPQVRHVQHRMLWALQKPGTTFPTKKASLV